MTYRSVTNKPISITYESPSDIEQKLTKTIREILLSPGETNLILPIYKKYLKIFGYSAFEEFKQNVLNGIIFNVAMSDGLDLEKAIKMINERILIKE